VALINNVNRTFPKNSLLFEIFNKLDFFQMINLRKKLVKLGFIDYLFFPLPLSYECDRKKYSLLVISFHRVFVYIYYGYTFRWDDKLFTENLMRRIDVMSVYKKLYVF